MNLYKRNNTIYVDFYDKSGKRHRKSLKKEWNKDNVALAKKELIPKIINEVELDTYGKSYTLSYFLDYILTKVKTFRKVSTYEVKKVLVKRVKDNIVDKDIKKYTYQDLEEFLLRLYSLGYKSSTIKITYGVLREAFNEALKREVIYKIPSPSFISKDDSVKKKAYSKDEVNTLISKASGELKIALIIAFNTGARVGEILAMDYNSLDGQYLVIDKAIDIKRKNLTTTKTNRSRKVPLSSEVYTLLKSLPKDKRFVNMTYQTLKYQLSQLCKKCEIPYYGIHNARHTFTTICLANGVSMVSVKEWLGHSSFKMIDKVYSHYQENSKDLETLFNSFGTTKDTVKS